MTNDELKDRSRIRELAEQALEIVSNKRMLKDGQLERTWDPCEYDHVFAELIVREVLAKIEYERFEIYQPVKDSVMKHFGVEE